MRSLPRIILGSCSVAIILLVVAIATALGPEGARLWLLVSGGIAVLTAIQGAASDPADLTPALIFSLPPVIALFAPGSPSWLIGPLGAFLLLSGELNALSWASQPARPMNSVRRHHLRGTAELVSFGLIASLVITMLGRGPSPDGTLAVLVAATALAALARVLFRRTTTNPSPEAR